MVTEMEPLVRVRTMTISDVRYAAALHLECLPHGLFPALGCRFLGHYLFSYATSPFGVALVVEVDGRPAGFLVGSFDDRSHREHVVRHNGTSLALRAGIAMLSRPTVAWRFLRTRLVRYVIGFTRRRGSSPPAPSGGPSPRSAVLSHVAVAPATRGSGAGSTLVRSFVQRVQVTEAAAAELLTRDDELGAAPFYARLGWEQVSDVVDRDGLRWARFRIELD